MPFPEQPNNPFTKEGIGVLGKGVMGCYGIFNADGRCIYIGEGDLGARLLVHLGGDNPCILLHAPNYWLAGVTPNHVAWEKDLIVEFAPLCNKQIG